MRNMQNTHILRFLFVLTAVILTIFIYASYSNSQTLLPSPMRTVAVMPSFQYQLYNNNNHEILINRTKDFSFHSKLYLNGTTNISKSNKIQQQQGLQHNQYTQEHRNHNYYHVLRFNDGIKKILHHQRREPTIDENANNNDNIVTNIDDLKNDANNNSNNSNNNNDLLQEEQYVQTIDNALENINQTIGRESNHIQVFESVKHKELLELDEQQKQQQQQEKQQQELTALNDNNSNNNNKISDSDVLIPTSNLQKFIENADKLVKNVSLQKQQKQHNNGKLIEYPNKSQVPLNLSIKPYEQETLKNEDHGVLLSSSPQKSVPEKLQAKIIKSKLQQQQWQENVNSKLNESEKTNDKQSTSKTIVQAIRLKAPKASVSLIKGSNAHRTETATIELYESGHLNNEIDVEHLCPKKGIELKLLILITSAQNHTEARMAIRQTWGHYSFRRDVSTAFVLGRTTDKTLHLTLTEENLLYGDLIRGHFIDSYNNLTLKTISALEWVDKNCPKVKFILKTDDDMFINVPKLLQFLDNHLKGKKTIYGRLAKKWKPIRNTKSKYFVSMGQFGASIFPTFTTGPAYVMTNDIIHDLYTKALQQVYLKLEDVFTTGIVAQKLGINRVHVNEFLNKRVSFTTCLIRKAISIHMIKPHEQFDLWKKLLDQSFKCK